MNTYQTKEGQETRREEEEGQQKRKKKEATSVEHYCDLGIKSILDTWWGFF